MRNRFAGSCYRCGWRVEPGDGHFERKGAGWRVQHACCAVWWRGQNPTLAEAEARYRATVVSAAEQPAISCPAQGVTL